MVISFLEVVDRAYNGPVCKERDWDAKIIPTKVREKLKEYGLEGTCTPENPVNNDDGLADEFWEAGFNLAVDIGYLCRETERVIKFTEGELKEAMRGAPSEITAGKGEDSIVIKARRPEDKRRPIAWVGPCSMACDEELVIPLAQSAAQYRVIDAITTPTPTKMYGREIRAGTVYETLAAKYQKYLMREACDRAGRHGMPLLGFNVSATEYAQLGGFGIPNGPDFGIVLPLTELKTSVRLLHKTAHDVINHEGMDMGNAWSMIGGYAGPPEGAAVCAIASIFFQRGVHFLTAGGGLVMDLRYMGNSGRDAIWAQEITLQAQSRNTAMLTRGFTSQVFGPCTPELLYETAAIAIADVASGIAIEEGTRPTGCKYKNYGSGLENKFAAEVSKAAAGMKRSDANEIAKALIPRYEDRLERPSKGKSFTECTDLKSLKPTKEWQDIYARVLKEVEGLGLPHF